MLKFKLNMKKPLLFLSMLSVIWSGSALSSLPIKAAGPSVEVWMTRDNLSTALQRQGDIVFQQDSPGNQRTIDVNDFLKYQQMDGFGASMTDSSAWLISHQLSDSKRAEVMERLFGQSGIGLSMLRQTIGASDFNWEMYSYADTAWDWNLNNFSINRDKPYIIPMVKAALTKNPQIKVMASPWSAPGWMKSTGSMIGGYLNHDSYEVYAQYLRRFIQSYQSEGIPIYAITPQNEPLFNGSNEYPTMYMSVDDQTKFIRDHLGPALRGSGLQTKIIAYDHNYDQYAYPRDVLNNAAAASYIAGSAFHHYGGDVTAMTTLHNLHPNKDIWFTEGGFGSWNDGFKNQIREMINVTRNWSKSYILWNIALDHNNGPSLLSNSINYGMLRIRSDAQDQVTYNNQYYAMGHLSKFVVPGAYRVDTNTYANSLDNVAFQNPDGSKVLVVANSENQNQTFKARWGNQSFTYTIPAGSALTFKWYGETTRDVISLKASANGKFVAAEDGGNSPLIANRDAVGGAWESFERINLGIGNYAFKSMANGRFVAAENAGASPLIARSGSIGTWETFQVASVSGGVTLRAAANSQFVSADNAGASPLIANRSTASGWETFQISVH
ncbi:glycoside hydrolase family 30 beta sandwich domain-containing protein [Paenibacillus sp. Cedars]|uniref:glycoside hydrolase family 30 beta sandwich domain-containing protein n=1 Tax=Paenibacillus sp. Cedars TaxID=1980674 RepID=UPI001162BD46|nr:glycoside hydrolase family 30 beta sandwich domain-containing protein [Paenibacillus sp. Cedars]AWP27812.1 glucan endo-1,6-beta-glucosidase [Paenibacillus sp. Cedars]